MQVRAYSTLEIKAAGDDDGKRTFSGIASTPTTDMGGDIMEPYGAQFTLPLPFLWQHDQKQPVGWIHKARPTDRGIEVEGEVAVVNEPGRLKDRLDEAWHAMKAKLVRGLSIGFTGLDAVRIPGGKGTHYKRWLWMELSAVVVPMNSEASILNVKRADVVPKPRIAYREFQANRVTPAMLAAPVSGKTLALVMDAVTLNTGVMVKRADAHAAWLRVHMDALEDLEQRIAALEGR